MRENYLENLCGIDEAVRGPFAGPLVVAGVVLKNDITELELMPKSEVAKVIVRKISEELV